MPVDRQLALACLALLACARPAAGAGDTGEPEVHDGEHHSVFEIGWQEAAYLPVQIGVLFIAIVIFSITVEHIVHYLKHNVSDVYEEVLTAVFSEIMLLGLVSFALFMMVDTEAINDIVIAGEPFNLHAFEFLHMAIFFVALSYILCIVVVWASIHEYSAKFSKYESYCLLTMSDVGKAGSNRFSDPGVDIKELRRPMSRGKSDESQSLHSSGGLSVDTDLAEDGDKLLIERTKGKLESYDLWRSQAGIVERTLSLDLHWRARRWRAVVDFHKVRKGFIYRVQQKRTRLPELETVLKSLEGQGISWEKFQFSRYVRKQLRHQIVECAEIGSMVWIVLAFFVSINTIRAAFEKQALEDAIEDDDYSNDDHGRRLSGDDGDDGHYVKVDLYHDYVYYAVVNYCLLLTTWFGYRKIDQLYQLFKKEASAEFSVNELLEAEARAGHISEAVRRQILQATEHEHIHDFHEQFWLGRPDLIFRFIKIIIMVSCWTMMYYILVFAPFFVEEDLEESYAVGLALLLLAPGALSMFFFIPVIVIRCTVILSTSDHNIDLNLILRTMARKDKELEKAQQNVLRSEQDDNSDGVRRSSYGIGTTISDFLGPRGSSVSVKSPSRFGFSPKRSQTGESGRTELGGNTSPHVGKASLLKEAGAAGPPPVRPKSESLNHA